jgi:hypothetical protein
VLDEKRKRRKTENCRATPTTSVAAEDWSIGRNSIWERRLVLGCAKTAKRGGGEAKNWKMKEEGRSKKEEAGGGRRKMKERQRTRR